MIILESKWGFMRIKKTVSKNFEFYYIIKDINRGGKRTTKIVENLEN